MLFNLFAKAAAQAPLALSGGWWALVAILLLVGLVVFLLFARFLGLWIRCLATKAGIGWLDLVGMWLRKVSPNVIVGTKIMAVQAGLAIETRDLESHYLAGGNAPKVVRALIAADRANIDLDFKTAAAIDLAGRDVLEAVQTSVLRRSSTARIPNSGGPPSTPSPRTASRSRPRPASRSGRTWNG